MQTQKKTIADLAIFGAAPEFQRALHVGAPNIGPRDELFSRLSGALDDRRLTNFGPNALEFERRVGEIAGATCISASSGTVALQIALRALGLTGEVIVPSFTFVATAHALQWLGITPVFCDIHPVTHTIDPAEAERLITARTTAIVGVHLWGRTCDIAALSAVASRHNLALVFDAAQAFACSYQGRPIGGYGNASAFSFHATKIVNSFEGGAIGTADVILAEKMRQMSNFGFCDYDETSSLGTNGKMSEAASAMGLVSLDRLADFIAHNRRNYQAYEKRLSGIPGISLLRYSETERSNYHYIVVEVADDSPISRDDLHRVLWSENVLARRYYYPGCHRMEPYRSMFPNVGERLPHTEKLAARVVSLPTGTAMQLDHVERVCQLIEFGVAHGSEVAAMLRTQR